MKRLLAVVTCSGLLACGSGSSPDLGAAEASISTALLPARFGCGEDGYALSTDFYADEVDAFDAGVKMWNASHPSLAIRYYLSNDGDASNATRQCLVTSLDTPLGREYRSFMTAEGVGQSRRDQQLAFAFGGSPDRMARQAYFGISQLAGYDTDPGVCIEEAHCP